MISPVVGLVLALASAGLSAAHFVNGRVGFGVVWSLIGLAWAVRAALAFSRSRAAGSGDAASGSESRDSGAGPESA